MSMDTFDAIKTSHTIKKLDSSYKMSSDGVKPLMELMILLSASYNQQNWRFVYVTNDRVKERISKAKPDTISVRTTISSSIVKNLDPVDDDTVEWDTNKLGSKWIASIKKG